MALKPDLSARMLRHQLNSINKKIWNRCVPVA